MEKKILSRLSEMIDVAPGELAGKSGLAELGIDSLLMMEVASEIDSAFGISIPQDTIQSLLNVDSVVDYLYRHGGANSSREPADEFALSPHLEDIEVIAITTILSTHLECSATEFHASTDLADKGLDSLLWMEVISDIEAIFDVTIDLYLTPRSKYGDLCDKLEQAIGHNCSSQATSSPFSSLSCSDEISTDSTKRHSKSVSSGNLDSSSANAESVSPFIEAPDDFESIKPEFDKLAAKYDFKHFFDELYQKNASLVLTYTVEAFAELGVRLGTLTPGDTIPLLDVLPRHHQLREVLYEILRDGGLADYDGKSYVRSETSIHPTHSNALFKQIGSDFPHHAKEHKLLDICGSNLAKLLIGSLDPLKLISGTKANRDTLEDVYSTSPMYVIMSQLLTIFLAKALGNTRPVGDGVFRIIELGAGTGSTTHRVVDRLVQQGVRIEYTFTDISSSLVSAAKHKFQKYD
ncbi:hypothetical protein INS49_007963 [Diaporthe citri]|uniref:uncharacterized protein n=1 Tax=Diaporthe citri TaxID=83186 RepID=UPI001C7F7ADB|nr:uncharacterized protein INS49_007963 [Diaporthe citri]KAG6362868.1 hypothetical protein INS49_007963 [Diaporthe citri]